MPAAGGVVEIEEFGTLHRARWWVTGGDIIVSMPFGGERRVPLGNRENAEERAAIILTSMIEDERRERIEAHNRTLEAARVKRAAGDRLGEMLTGFYGVGAALTALAVFAGSWVYCIVTYGYLLGVGLGWLPSIIVAAIAAFLWPVIALLAVAFIALVYKAGG